MKKLLYTFLCVASCWAAAVAQIPTNGLQASYKFENSLADSSGNNNDFTASQPLAITYVPGHDAGTGINLLNGTYCTQLSAGVTLSNTEMAVSFWAKFDSAATNPTQPYVIYNIRNSTTNIASYSVEYQASAGNQMYITLYAYYNSGYTNYSALIVPVGNYRNAWHQYTAVHSATEGLMFYVDGVLVRSGGGMGIGMVTNPNPNQFMVSLSNSYCFRNGQLDDILVYNRALTTTEIENIYTVNCPPQGITFQNYTGVTAIECQDNSSLRTIFANATTPSGSLNYQWYKDGQPIPGDVYQSLSYGIDPFATGVYHVRIFNLCDTVQGPDFDVLVIANPNTPSITRQGNQLTASVAGDGYEWLLDGQILSGTTTRTITATATGNYTVRVYKLESGQRCYSSVSQPLAYNASCADTISGNVINNVTFDGCATGSLYSYTPNLTGNGIAYQWYKNGTAINGAVFNAYDLSIVPAFNGTYTMKAYTSCDTVTYGTLTVAVIEAPHQLTVTVTDSIIAADQLFSKYIWLLNGDTLPEITRSITMTATGYYSVLVSDGVCYSPPSDAYFYLSNNGNCSFNTTYEAGAGRCPDVAFTLNDAALPVTAYIRYTGQATANAHTLTNNVSTITEFCPSTYEIILVDDNGCVDSLNFTILEVGIGHIGNNISLSVYPNPVNQTLMISTSETLTGVEVYNVMGQRVLSKEGDTAQIDVATLPAGTYYLNAVSANGSARKAFVKY